MLYAKQKRLVQMVADQVYEREKNNDMMVNILSHIVAVSYTHLPSYNRYTGPL